MEKENIKVSLPRWDQLPNLDLYLDQVVTLIEEYLNFLVITEDEKIITKTMINNYVKHGVLKSPENKKYNKEHLAKLIVICILKQIYSISEISNLINLALDVSQIEKSYNRFCIGLENAIDSTFNNKEFKLENVIEQTEILKAVVLSFSNKLYVEKMFLNKDLNKK